MVGIAQVEISVKEPKSKFGNGRVEYSHLRRGVNIVAIKSPPFSCTESKF